MSGVKGKVGEVGLNWKTIPRGPRGEAQVEVEGGDTLHVTWRQDADGLWLELPDGVWGFDIRAERQDDGTLLYDLQERGSGQAWKGLTFLRQGEEQSASGSAGRSGTSKVKAEMPGKVVRLAVKDGDKVERGQRLLVMEAMKMENEIIAPVAGRVGGIVVKAGDSVESGAVLLTVTAEGS